MGGFSEPAINRTPFYWYVFAIPGRRPWTRPHYLVCDYLQVRDWVLDFTAPLGRGHRNHRNWRADIRAFIGEAGETMAYFRWGDEPIESEPRPSRVVQFGNGGTIGDPVALKAGLHVGSYGRGGESAAHRKLKLYVAAHPDRFGLSRAASPHVEYSFLSGDRVDVLFENHQPNRTVVEVEVAGEQNVLVGIHQAVKYRSLAELDGGYALLSAHVRSLVVAYDTNYARALDLAGRYNVDLQSVDRSLVLATAP